MYGSIPPVAPINAEPVVSPLHNMLTEESTLPTRVSGSVIKKVIVSKHALASLISTL